jgi:hypothetical protein
MRDQTGMLIRRTVINMNVFSLLFEIKALQATHKTPVLVVSL